VRFRRPFVDGGFAKGFGYPVSLLRPPVGGLSGRKGRRPRGSRAVAVGGRCRAVLPDQKLRRWPCAGAPRTAVSRNGRARRLRMGLSERCESQRRQGTRTHLRPGFRQGLGTVRPARGVVPPVASRKRLRAMGTVVVRACPSRRGRASEAGYRRPRIGPGGSDLVVVGLVSTSLICCSVTTRSWPSTVLRTRYCGWSSTNGSSRKTTYGPRDISACGPPEGATTVCPTLKRWYGMALIWCGAAPAANGRQLNWRSSAPEPHRRPRQPPVPLGRQRH
jgi:hypothetical protein